MKKYFWSMIVMALFAIGFASSDDSKEAEQLVGDYVVNDSKGTTWYFHFTADNKVTVKLKGMSDDDMYYGRWSGNGGDDNGLCHLDFRSFHAGNPPIEFPKGRISDIDYMEVSDDGWIYNGRDNLKAKNPNSRLKMNKQ